MVFYILLQCAEFLEYLVVECADILRDSLKLLDPLPELPKLVRVTVKLDHLKYADGEFTLQQVGHNITRARKFAMLVVQKTCLLL